MKELLYEGNTVLESASTAGNVGARTGTHETSRARSG